MTKFNEHIPDAKTRGTVEAMASYGITQADICSVLDIDLKTLRKHYRYELDTALAKANSQVAQRLYQKALQGDTSSMIFWLKTRARWREGLDLSSEDGSMTPIIKVEFVGGHKDTGKV